MTTITASTTLGLTLTPAGYTSPVVIAPGVSISKSFGGYGGGYAIYNLYGAFAILNYGAIAGLGSRLGFGVYLYPGGSVTNAAAASIIGRDDGVLIRGTSGTVVNDGSIAGTDSFGIGIQLLDASGLVTNDDNASISGYSRGVLIDGVATSAARTVINAGRIGATGTGGAGIYLANGGSVTNASSGSISGHAGVVASTSAASFINLGSVAGIGTSGLGVKFMHGGSLINAGTGSISGATGVAIYGAAGLVTNAAAASISGTLDALALGSIKAGGAGTVLNAGRIAGGTSGIGVYLPSGGMVSNAASASITAGDYGIEILAAGGTVVNSGMIGATVAAGVRIVQGSITNMLSASITGALNGVAMFGGGSVFNAGSISGRPTFGTGAYFNGSSGSITNAASGLITGGRNGVELRAGGSLTNAGTIVGGIDAVYLGGISVTNLLALIPGCTISGAVVGSINAFNVLELVSAASAGTLTGLGTQFTNFGAIDFDPGSKWSISGNTSGLAPTINGFAPGDTIEVTGVTTTGTTYAGGILTLEEAAGSATLRIPGTFTIGSFHVANNAAGTEVTVVACFAKGTRIASVRGEVAVERLRVGDHVLTHDGKRMPVKWIGWQHVDCRRHARQSKVWPVRIRPDAFGNGRPHRVLWLSPDHAVYLDGALTPVRYLINGLSVAQVPVRRVTYYHVELSSHDVLVAEGMPCESYLDTGNREAFANAGPLMHMDAEFAFRVWETKAYAPLILSSPRVEAARQIFLARPANLARSKIGRPAHRSVPLG